MMPLIHELRSVLGSPTFYFNGELNYEYVIEYLLAGIILCVVISSVFRFLGKLVSR